MNLNVVKLSVVQQTEISLPRFLLGFCKTWRDLCEMNATKAIKTIFESISLHNQKKWTFKLYRILLLYNIEYLHFDMNIEKHIYIYIYVYMYVCMYVYIYIYIYCIYIYINIYILYIYIYIYIYIFFFSFSLPQPHIFHFCSIGGKTHYY